ncbi:MAG: aldo/keto reductase [Pseudonocardiales bacterium]|nr:aldo/keto reductase [Pseudonocardiales bacterium]
MLEQALQLGVTALDIAYNYFGFKSHHTLARIAGDLLPLFTISTKLGFFPTSNDDDTQHCLDPKRLRQALEETTENLQRLPNVVLLHNPEHSLRTLADNTAQACLAEAFLALQEATDCRLCHAWGISTWDPRPLVPVLRSLEESSLPRPTVAMVRTGVLVSARVLDAAEYLYNQLGVHDAGRWGMSPFGGGVHAQVWRRVDCRALLMPDQDCSNLQAAFRLAFALPTIAQVAVSTNRSDHLRALVEATSLKVDTDKLLRYRRILQERQATPAGEHDT